MIETPIEVHPSNGEVVDWQASVPFNFKLKGDNISYAICEVYNLSTNKIKKSKTFELFKNGNGYYNNETVKMMWTGVFGVNDSGKDYKYRYYITQQNPNTTNLEKDGSYGLYRIETGHFIIEASHLDKVDVWDTIEFPNMPSDIFPTLVEFEGDPDETSHKFVDGSTARLKASLYLAKLHYGDGSTKLRYFSSFSCTEKWIKTTSEIPDHSSIVAIELYVCINSVNPKIYIGRNSLPAQPINSYGQGSDMRVAGLSWVLLENSIPNYRASSRWTGTTVSGPNRTPYGVRTSMYIKIGDEIRRIAGYRKVYNKTSDNTQYWLCFQPPLPDSISLNTPVEFYTNYITTPWYDFKLRRKPKTSLTVERNSDTGFLKCASTYSHLDGISLKSYNFSVYNNGQTKCVATTDNQYSYRQEWEFPVPTITTNYSASAVSTTQENDSVSAIGSFRCDKYDRTDISTVKTDDQRHSVDISWSKNDFTLGLGDVGEYYNIYRKIDDGKNRINASDDFVFIGTTQSLDITDYTAGNNQSYCYQIENSGENNIHTLLDLTFAEQSFNSEPQTNTPFASENYSYTSSISSTTGVYSNPFVMPNGKYHINVISQNKPSNMEMVIYNPYYGCYDYGDNDYVDLDWEKIDDNYYIYDFEIKTDYKQNYVMLGDPSKNMNKWLALDIQLYQITPYTYLYTAPITTNWDGWSISALTRTEDFYGLHKYSIGDTWNFYTELNEPTITQQNDFQVHNGTAQYGQISRGNNNYDSGTFTSNIIEMECPDKIIYDDIDKVQKWKKFIYDNEAFLLKSSKGDVWIVGITDSPTRQYEQGINEPTIVSYNWIEIDDVRKAIIV